MGTGNHVVVVDVSSDEEVDTRFDRDYLNFLNKAVDVKSDSTDVVSVDSQLNSWTQAALEDEEDDDDDCVILDCDPEKTSAEVEADDDDNDEVLVVGQKGEIACRDFPHPRHSCAKYSFNSTSHESYCDMCHCYVCDIPAPCPYWCVAVSSIDHCHANDKDQTWKNQREFFRTGNMPLPTQPAHATVSPPQSIIRLSQNPSPRNKIEIRPCANRAANLFSNVRVRQSSPRNHGLQSLTHNAIQKDRSTYMGNLRSRTRYGNNIKAGLYTNAKAHHNPPSVVAAPTTTINPEMYTQQRQLNVTAAAVTGSPQCNADLFRLPEWVSQAETETVQQQDENVLQAKLSEVESWLMDNCNQAGVVSPLPEPVAQDNVTFDFETFLND